MQTHHKIISSVLLDQIVSLILNANESGDIQIPARLISYPSYGKDFDTTYRVVDRAWINGHIESMSLSTTQLSILDALARWGYQNSGDSLRSALGLLGTALSHYKDATNQNAPLLVENNGTVVEKFLNESTWAIRRLIKSSVIQGAIEAKLPMRDYAEEFNKLIRVSEGHRKYGLNVEQNAMSMYLANTPSNMSLSEGVVDREEYAARRLIQMVKAVAEYKRDHEFSLLRRFLNNGSAVATFIRMNTTSKDIDMKMLSADVLDHLHSCDRLLSSNCVAANKLLERMARGEIVYDEILEMGRHQHRIVAIELNSTMLLFSSMLRIGGLRFSKNSEFIRVIRSLIKYSGIQSNYLNELESLETVST